MADYCKLVAFISTVTMQHNRDVAVIYFTIFNSRARLPVSIALRQAILLIKKMLEVDSIQFIE